MSILRVVPLAGTAEATIHAGAWARQAPCAIRPDEELLALPEQVMTQVGLQPGDAINVEVHDAGRHLHLGPLVGVLLGPDIEKRLHASSGERYRQMTEAARSIGAMLFFCELASIDRKAGQVRGWLQREGQWTATPFPIPDVIYHRTTFPDPDQRRRAARLMRELHRLHDVIILNSANAFSKTHVYEALHFFSDTRSLTPETVRFGNMAALDAMLERHPFVFLKAEHGSHGSDVLRVDGGETWQVRGKAGGGPVNEIFPNCSQLEKFLSGLKSQTEWVIQQGIELPQVDGRIFDLRTIVQKDGRGEWVVPRVLVRLAPAGSVIANTSQGATPYLAPDFVKRFGKQLPHLDGMAETATTAALGVALALEARFGLLGEIGVDIGIDQQGRPWVFEANAKPLHRQIPGGADSLDRLPLHYAAYLARRSWGGRYTGYRPPGELP